MKSSGYTAEFGGATGGVINVITKSGTNDWRGNALFNWQGDNLRAGNTQTLRTIRTTPMSRIHPHLPKDANDNIEPRLRHRRGEGWKSRMVLRGVSASVAPTS